MKLGVILPQAEVDSPSRSRLRAYVQAVEDLGFDHLMAYDHVVGADRSVRPGWTGAYDHATPFLEPLTLFAHLAGICDLEFVTDILILPQRQTALVAKQAATLDVLSEGRFRFGVGIGWNDVEYDTLNADFSTRGRRFEEQLGLLRRYWTEESVQFTGEFDHADHVGVRPLPVQRPIPLWIGCSDSPRALDRVGRLADGFIPHPELRWGGQLETAIETARAIAARRPEPVSLGLQGAVRWYEDSPARLRTALDRWRGVEATHVAINTLRAGFSWPDGHIEALREVADQWELSPRASGGAQMKLTLDEVVKLQSSYSYSHDHGELTQFIDLFADDAVFTLPSGQQIAGRDALVEWVKTSNGAGVHTSGAPLIGDDDTARTPFVFVARGGARIASGYYHDTFARSETGGLVFSRRSVETFPAPDPKPSDSDQK